MTTVHLQRSVPREGGGDQGGEGPPVHSQGKGPSAGRALLGAPSVAEECSYSRDFSFLCEVGGKDAKNGAKRGVKRSGFKGVKKVRERRDGAAGREARRHRAARARTSALTAPRRGGAPFPGGFTTCFSPLIFLRCYFRIQIHPLHASESRASFHPAAESPT